ncbi:MAG: hypothetical protein Cons2KO_27950 [Congregibacter sp.]
MGKLLTAIALCLSLMSIEASAQTGSNERLAGDLGGGPTPVPAPATIALVGLGAALLIKRRR